MKITTMNFIIQVKLFFSNLFITNEQNKKNFFVSSFTVILTIISLILINWLIYLFYPDNTEDLVILAKKLIIEGLHSFIDGPGGAGPEPIERAQILITFFSTPLLIFIYIKLFSSKLFNQILITNNMYFLNLAFHSTVLAILFYFAFTINGANLFQHETYFYQQKIIYYFNLIIGEPRFLISLIFFPLITYFIFNGLPKKQEKYLNWVLYLYIATLLLSGFLINLCNSGNYYGNPMHISTFLYPISQVQQGKTLLVDFYSSQYGLYPHFLYPFFKLINVNVISFSLTMSALTTISYSLIFFGLRKIISNNLIVFFSFVAILYFASFPGLFPDNYDSYFQYRPLRIIFPSLILFSVFTYILNPNKFKYLLIIFISSLAILWNFDSGVICFLSFYIYILYEGLIGNNLRTYASKFFRHTLISGSVLTLTFFLYSIIIYFQSNNFPDWSLFLASPKLFGMVGLTSLPMTVFSVWNLIFLVYLYGIYIGINAVLFNKKEPLDKVAFFVSIFGLGISTYYLNRSHDLNLLNVVYPAFILLGIFLSKVLDKEPKESLFQIKNFLMVSTVSFILVVIFFQTLQPNKIINTLANRISDIYNNRITSNIISNGVTLFNFNSDINDKVVILSEHDGLMYLVTKSSSPFSVSSATELILKSDWDVFQNTLINNKSYKVYVSDSYQKKGVVAQTRYSAFKKIFSDHYYLDDWFGNWRVFTPKEYKITNKSTIKAKATYSPLCSNNSNKCNTTVKNFHSLYNLNKNTKFIKVEFTLSQPITLQSIMLHIIKDSKYNGTLTTLPMEELLNIGILNTQNKKFVNTAERSNQLNYKVNQNFSVLIPDSNYMKQCEPFNIELTYNTDNKIKLRALCKADN